MRISSLITGIVASSSLSTACYESGSHCPEPTIGPFDLHSELTQDQAEQWLASELSPSEEIDNTQCEALCASATANMVLSIDSCQAEWVDSVAGDTGDTGDTGMGGNGTRVDIQCSGEWQSGGMCLGRRPMGHTESSSNESTPLARFFAEAAHLETAAVAAFRQLARQLERYDAPEDLVHRCIEAARDEVCHAWDMGRMAHLHGASIPPFVPPRQIEETLLAIAVHNAVEGCVSETWAAMMAQIQAERAATPELRALFANIARDEMAHGQLAWDLHAWLLEQLDAAGRAQVMAAQREALKALPAIAARQIAQLPPELGGGSGRLGLTMASRLALGLAA
jgi:hypothetical protein